MANGAESESIFDDEMRRVVREEMEAAMGSRTNTPWSAQNFDPQGEFGVTVPKTFDEIFVETGTLRGVIGASDPSSAFYSSRRQPSDVPNFNALPTNERRLFEVAAKAIHPLKTGQGYYEDLIEASWDLSTKGIYRSPQQLAYEAYAEGGGAGGAGGGGRYTGPRESVTMMNERDLKTTADSIAAEVLGRPVSDEEFQRVLRRIRSAEMEQPTVTRRVGGQTVTESGLSQQGRQDIITDMLMQGPEAEDFVKATTMMDAFYKALSEGPRGS